MHGCVHLHLVKIFLSNPEAWYAFIEAVGWKMSWYALGVGCHKIEYEFLVSAYLSF